MFSFLDGKLIGKVIGGKYGKKLIYVTEKPGKGTFKKISLHDKGIMIPMPDIDGRSVDYTCGPSGSGKTTHTAKKIIQFQHIFPDNNVFVFSRLNQDHVLDKIQPKLRRMTINEDMIKDPIDIHTEFKEGDIILFDDCDTIVEKNLADAVSKLKNDILETGRHKNLNIIVTSHLINGNNRKDTKTILNECHTLTIFPKSGSAYGIIYTLKNYMGLSGPQINKILKLPSRWVTVGKTYPQYVIYEKGAYLL